ncbi:hypothetical protein ZIOFF_040326 [Zingiber officinale]|uniref:Uncharacterized protein n=1 Tax=Zingiber officinale TaxID=94328 RepID=A0A8J5G607_ZINOF|nr:hypothetical protein ZIOFF_040326 [Zingiber officinale]
MRPVTRIATVEKQNKWHLPSHSLLPAPRRCSWVPQKDAGGDVLEASTDSTRTGSSGEKIDTRERRMIACVTATAMITDVARSPDAFLGRSPAFSAFCHLSTKKSLEPARERADEEESGGGGDFEFRLHDPISMLHADELFADGKLVPLHLAAATRGEAECAAYMRSVGQQKTRRRTDAPSGSDQYVFSPRAPSCAIRWRELLRLKKAAGPKLEHENAVKSRSHGPEDGPSRKHFFHRSPKSSSGLEPAMCLPLLREPDAETVLVSSRLSLSSSCSSGRDHEDLHRLSLDAAKPHRHMPMLRLVRPLPATAELPLRGRIRRGGSSDMVPGPGQTTTGIGLTMPVDSPRMNPSGKVVFHGLERSSSSPGSFTGGPRPRLQGMERSYSANVVRVSPVLNVPVCSLAKTGPVFRFAGQLFSPQKKEKANPTASQTAGGGRRRSKS